MAKLTPIASGRPILFRTIFGYKDIPTILSPPLANGRVASAAKTYLLHRLLLAGGRPSLVEMCRDALALEVKSRIK
jgi:hypothetical protein